jgi:streptolysin S family bacteriocin protoxin
MRGLKRLRSARVISTGHAFIQNLRRGHYEFGIDVDPRHRLQRLAPNSRTPFNTAPQLSLPAFGQRNTALSAGPGAAQACSTVLVKVVSLGSGSSRSGGVAATRASAQAW